MTGMTANKNEIFEKPTDRKVWRRYEPTLDLDERAGEDSQASMIEEP